MNAQPTLTPSDIQKKIVKAFNELNGRNLEILNDFYEEAATFEDPVSKAEGLTDIKKYYAHVYKNVKSIRFDFKDIRHQENHYYAHWTMHLQATGLNAGQSFPVEGMSYMKFNEKGKVVYHRDYLDLGSMLYERLPLIGSVVSFIKGRLKH